MRPRGNGVGRETVQFWMLLVYVGPLVFGPWPFGCHGVCEAADFYLDASRAIEGNGSVTNPWKSWSAINWTTISNAVSAQDVTLFLSSRDVWSNTASFQIKSGGGPATTFTVSGDQKYNEVDSGQAVWLTETGSSQRATFVGAGTSGGDVKVQSNTSRLHVRGLKVCNPAWGGINLGNVNPSTNIHHIVIENCVIDSPRNNHGIWFGYAEDGCSDLTVRGCEVRNTPLEGIYVGHYCYLGNGISNVVIEGNRLIDCGLSVEGDIDIKPAAYGAIVRSNEHYRTSAATNGSCSGVVVAADACKIYGNRFHHTKGRASDWGFGIFVNADGDGATGQAISSCLIYNNFIYGCERAGVKLTANKTAQGASLRGVVVLNNDIWMNKGYGIQVSASPPLVAEISSMHNNIIGQNGGYDVLLGVGSVLLDCDDNLYYRTSGESFSKNSTSKSFAEWKALGYDVHSIWGDPLFRDAANGDFALTAGSPAVDAGTNRAAFFTCDANGGERPVGGAWDIGALECVPTNTVNSAVWPPPVDLHRTE